MRVQVDGQPKDVCLSSFENQQRQTLFDCGALDQLKVHAQSTSNFGAASKVPNVKRLSLTESVLLIQKAVREHLAKKRVLTQANQPDPPVVAGIANDPDKTGAIVEKSSKADAAVSL